MTDNPITQLHAAVEEADVLKVQGCLAEGATAALPQLERLWTTATVAEAVTALFTAFPDFLWHPSRRHEADGAIVEEGVWSGTHRGPLAQIAATSRPARVTYDLVGTAIASMTISTDLAALVLALGLPVSRAAAAQSAAAYAGVETPTSTAVIRPMDPAASEPARGPGRRRAVVLASVALAVVAAAIAVMIAARATRRARQKPPRRPRPNHPRPRIRRLRSPASHPRRRPLPERAPVSSRVQAQARRPSCKTPSISRPTCCSQRAARCLLPTRDLSSARSPNCSPAITSPASSRSTVTPTTSEHRRSTSRSPSNEPMPSAPPCGPEAGSRSHSSRAGSASKTR
jgi:hypothetical protein